MRNKLYIILAGILCFGVMAACDIPQSATIKGHPGLYINLGSPFGADNDILGDDLNANTLTHNLGGEFKGKIYQYLSSNIDLGPNDGGGRLTISGQEVQTYLIHFPITELSLDLSQYLTEANPGIALDIPDLFPFSPGDKLPSTRVGPELTLEMKDITKWVNEIEINKMEDTAKISRIVLTGTQVLLTSLQDSMQLKLENIGITNFVNGVLNTEGTELVFTATTTVPHFKPASEEMVIETQFTKVPESGTVNIAVDLQWIKAEIKPGNTGEFEDIIRGLDLSSLGDLLVGAQFGEIPAYLYISGLDNANARMSLSAAAGETPITPDVLTEHDVVSTSLPVLTDGYLSDIVATETSVGQFFLQDVFNAGGNVAITYKIKIDTLTIPNDADHINQKIKADMVVVLPLRLTINSTESFEYPDPDPAATPKKTYVKLDLDALSDLTGDGKDLLGRDPGDDSLFIDGLALDRATILISGIKNGVIDGLYLAVIKDPNDPSAEVQVISLNEGKSGDITFTGDELRSPFSPTFQLLVEKGEYIFVKTFDDEHPATLDLNLALSARTDLNISQKF